MSTIARGGTTCLPHESTTWWSVSKYNSHTPGNAKNGTVHARHMSWGIPAHTASHSQSLLLLHRVQTTHPKPILCNAGAGVDTRAWHLAWPPGFRVYEVDTPAVLAFKARIMSLPVTAADGLTGHGERGQASLQENCERQQQQQQQQQQQCKVHTAGSSNSSSSSCGGSPPLLRCH